MLTELAARGAAQGTFRYLGLAHKPPREAAALAAAGIPAEAEPAPLGVIWQQLRAARRLGRGDIDSSGRP